MLAVTVSAAPQAAYRHMLLRAEVAAVLHMLEMQLPQHIIVLLLAAAAEAALVPEPAIWAAQAEARRPLV